MVYIGVGSNRGKIYESDEKAIREALLSFDLEPVVPFWQGFNYELFKEHFDLESFYSDEWLIMTEADYEAEQESKRLEDDTDEQMRLANRAYKERMYWDEQQYRTGSRL